MGFIVVLVFLAATLMCGIPLYGWLISPGKGVWNKPLMRTWDPRPPALSPALIPLLGLAALSAVLSVVTLLRIPIRYSAWPVLLLFAAIFAVYAIKNKNIPAMLPQRHFWIGLTVVVLCCGMGYYLSITQYYRGSDFYDQTYYISQAQFYIDYPFDYDVSVFTNAPWAHYFPTGHIFRYTTAFLAAFLSQICFAPDAGYVYAAHTPMIGILAFCAAHVVAGRLDVPSWLRKWLPVSAACVAGFILLPLDCFFPSGYSVPLTIVLGLMLFDLAKEFTLKRVLAVSLLFAFSTAAYTEMTYMYIGLMGVALAMGVIRKQFPLRNACGALLLPVAGCAMINLQQLYIYPASMSPWWAIQWGDALSGQYIAYMNTGGITRLFFAYPQNLSLPLIDTAVGFVSICLILASFAGLAMMVFREKESWPLTLLAVAAFPLLFIANSNDVAVYRFYRTLSQAAPVYVIGIGYFISRWQDMATAKWFRKLLIGGVAILAAAGCLATAYITVRKTNSHRNDPGIIAQWKRLEQMENEQICYVGGFGVNTRWDMYYARSNDIWGLAKVIHYNIYAPYDTFYDLRTLPLDNCKFIYSSEIVPMVSDEKLRKDVIAALVDQEDNLIYTWGRGIYLEMHAQLYQKAPEDQSYNRLSLKALSKIDIRVKLRLICRADLAEPENVEIDGNAYTVSSGETLDVEVDLHRGVQYIPIICSKTMPFTWVSIVSASEGI